jgi:hypothetical protein
MTVLRHNFEGGSQGTTITAATYGVPDDPWDEVPPKYGNTDNYYSASLSRPSAEWIGTVSTMISTGVDDPCWVWDSLGNRSSIYARWYCKVNNVPSVTLSPTVFGAQTGGTSWGTGTTWCTFVSLAASNQKLVVADGNGANPSYTVNAYQLDAWFRVELVLNFSATVGSGELRYYGSNPDADVEDWEDRIVFSGKDFNSATASRFAFGITYAQKPIDDISFSGCAISTDGIWIGPEPWRAGKGFPNMNLSNPIAIHHNVM